MKTLAIVLFVLLYAVMITRPAYRVHAAVIAALLIIDGKDCQ